MSCMFRHEGGTRETIKAVCLSSFEKRVVSWISAIVPSVGSTKLGPNG